MAESGRRGDANGSAFTAGPTPGTIRKGQGCLRLTTRRARRAVTRARTGPARGPAQIEARAGQASRSSCQDSYCLPCRGEVRIRRDGLSFCRGHSFGRLTRMTRGASLRGGGGGQGRSPRPRRLVNCRHFSRRAVLSVSQGRELLCINGPAACIDPCCFVFASNPPRPSIPLCASVAST